MTAPVIWRPRTAKDALDDAHQASSPAHRAPARTAAPTVPLEPENPLVACSCGRRNNADMMLDIRALTTAERTAFGRGGHGDYVCPDCRRRAELTGELPFSALARALGAPLDHVAALAARERAHDLRPER